MPENAWTLTYTDVMGLCRLAYVNRSEHSTTYLVAGREWYVETIWTDGPFRAITVTGKDQNNQMKKIVSFSGSDIELGDWDLRGNAGAALLSSECTRQYQAGLQVANKVKPHYFTGHSLGGGIALYCGVTLSIRAATINPSPLFNNVFGTQFNQYNSTAWAINYCVDGEMLAAGRNAADLGAFGVTIGATPGKRVSVQSTATNPLDKHYLHTLVGFTEPVKKNAPSYNAPSYIRR